MKENLAKFVEMNTGTMNFLANKSLKFISDRYEEWSCGQCISQGPGCAEISITASDHAIDVVVKGADSLRMYKSCIFSPIDDSGISVDLGDRIQYLNPHFIQGDPLEVILCHIFYKDRSVSYIRFAMSSPDRIIEFYGKTVMFDGVLRPETETEQSAHSFKGSFIDEIASQYRLLLKENTETLAIIDHQLACVAFSLKKYFSLVAMLGEDDDNLRAQVFKDSSSIISQFYPIFGNEALEIARNWYNQFADNMQHTESFLQYYEGQLKAGEPVDGFKVQAAFRLR